MDGKYFSMLDMVIVGLPVIIIGVWQLIAVNRAIAQDTAAKEAAKDAAKAAATGSPESARHPVGEHRLDDR